MNKLALSLVVLALALPAMAWTHPQDVPHNSTFAAPQKAITADGNVSDWGDLNSLSWMTFGPWYNAEAAATQSTYAWSTDWLYVLVRTNEVNPGMEIGGLVRTAGLTDDAQLGAGQTHVTVNGTYGKSWTEGGPYTGPEIGANGTQMDSGSCAGDGLVPTALTVTNQVNGGAVPSAGGYTKDAGVTYIELALPIYGNWIGAAADRRTLAAGDVIAAYADVYNSDWSKTATQTYVTPAEGATGWGPYFFGTWQDVNENNTQVTLVPEPASMALLALGGLALLRRRS